MGVAVQNNIIANLVGDVGRVLYGPAFYEPLARALGVEENTVRQWHRSHTRVPYSVLGDLMKAVIIASEAALAYPEADLRMLGERIFRGMKYEAFVDGFQRGELTVGRFMKALQAIGFTHGEAIREVEFYRSAM